MFYLILVLSAVGISVPSIFCFLKVDRWLSGGFSIGSRAHVRLTCWKQAGMFGGRVTLTRFNFSYYTNVFCCFFFVYMVNIKTQSRRPNNIQKTSSQSYKTQIKILLFLGHRNLIKNKTQTAVINILNLHILIMTWRFVCALHTFSKVTVEIWNSYLYIYYKGEGTGT